VDPAIADRLTSFFDADPRGAVAVYVFGSTARGEETAGSDVDVAVLFDETPAPSLTGPALTLQSDLDRLLGRSVDVIVLNTAPSDLIHRVLRDGVIVLDRDRARRLRFEVAKRNEFFDLEPVRRRYRRQSRSEPAARS
jgi:predicted nucleotidyltransferase